MWRLPAIHVQVHPLGFLEAAEVRGHLRLFHGLALQVAQALDELDALEVFAADEGLLGRLKIQFLEGSLSQQTPDRFTTETGFISRAVCVFCFLQSCCFLLL